MASISSLVPPTIFQQSSKSFLINTKTPTKPFLHLPRTGSLPSSHGVAATFLKLNPSKPLSAYAVAEEASVSTQDLPSEAAKRLYVGNIPRTVDNAELTRIFSEHGEVEKAEVMYDKYSGRSRRFGFVNMKTVEDANAVIEKLSGTEIGGRQIKVNVTEKPLQSVDLPLQAEESQFIDSPHKVYVGNLAKTVTLDTLTNFFAEKVKVLSVKISRVPGTSKSSGYGFVTFSTDDDVEAAISSFNNVLLDGQPIRVNKA
ncbi:30S ribosomal protein 2, chloroplastic [Macadamia integrifolia]|uniref:30S ribosomal protein 2, chloroplastic n=1 Tax=Macadamia integrifolia TaxID=60698 RepID=UPI001C5330E6|nr:30S ribosomal protein 2, chloroplastic [Macadamia integrifolia]